LKIIGLLYVEQNPKASETIIFIHGIGGSAHLWNKQFNAPELGHYRLIAIDLPGHGRSYEDNNSAINYSPKGVARLLAAAITRLAKDKYIIAGFSYATNLVAEMMYHNLNPIGVVLLSPSITGEGFELDKIFTPSTTESIFLKNETNPVVVHNFFTSFTTIQNEEDIRRLTADYFATDEKFRPAVLESVITGQLSDEIKAFANVPLLICFGEEDKLLNIHYLDEAPLNIWNGIQKLEGCSHWLNLENAPAVNKLIADFAEDLA
jgi:pimeloyl-ACP methyl ester carboxylesterase